jgi:hypothetical protein
LRRVRRLAVSFCLVAAGCARIAPPPGGPPDRQPPLLIGVSPDSLRVLADFDDEVEFEFDEVVSEGSAPNFGLGTGDLERLILLSPDSLVPKIGWHRNRITVRPREGWEPNRVYRVELLAGLRDLRNNTATRSTVVTFTTGAPLPTDTLVGRVIDWTTQRAAQRSLIEAALLPDSLVYRGATDSTGRFRLGPLPPGTYLVYGILDQNNNRRRDGREHFDSLRVASRDSIGELWAFRHDTVAARIQTITKTDSVTAMVTFNQSLDPYFTFSADSARLIQLPDSTEIRVVSLMPQRLHDSLARILADSLAKARADSVARAKGDTLRVAADTAPARPDSAARRDTAAVRIPGVPRQLVGGRRAPVVDTMDFIPLTKRPPLGDKLVFRSAAPFAPGARYLLFVRGVRSVSGVVGDASGPLVIDAARPDSARADSTRARGDTIPPPATRPPPRR